MVYKKGPAFKIRPVEDIKEDLKLSRMQYGPGVRTLFFPAGNTIAMPTDDLADICVFARSLFPRLERITTYGSSRYIYEKGLANLKRLKNSGLSPDFIRLRTFLPKINTLLLHQIQRGRFQVLSAHEVLEETKKFIGGLKVTSEIFSDHYTNYVNVHGKMPKDRDRMLRTIHEALKQDESYFRPIYVGTQ
jgi:hypothetical protein